jgi:hypothetical protein
MFAEEICIIGVWSIIYMYIIGVCLYAWPAESFCFCNVDIALGDLSLCNAPNDCVLVHVGYWPRTHGIGILSV